MIHASVDSKSVRILTYLKRCGEVRFGAIAPVLRMETVTPLTTAFYAAGWDHGFVGVDLPAVRWQ